MKTHTMLLIALFLVGIVSAASTSSISEFKSCQNSRRSSDLPACTVRMLVLLSTRLTVLTYQKDTCIRGDETLSFDGTCPDDLRSICHLSHGGMMPGYFRTYAPCVMENCSEDEDRYSEY